MRLKRYFFILLLLLANQWLGAQTADSLSRGSSPVGFNALKYSMQKRYVNKGDPFGNKRIQDNLFFQVGVGYESILGSEESLYDGGLRYGFSVGKMLTRLHSVRLNVSYVSNNQFLGTSLYRVGVGVDHLFDLSAYTAGYDASRMISFSTVEGVGLQFASHGEQKATAPEAHLGFQVRWSPTSRFDVYAEPYIGMGSRGLFGGNTRNLYGTFYGVNLGLRYQIHDRNFVPKRWDIYEKEGNFLDFSTGVVLPFSTLNGRGAGPAVSVGYGRWVLPGVAMHVSGQVSTSQWHKANYEATADYDAYQASENTAYMGGRAELVFDPKGFFQGYEDWESWKFYILAGVEAGYMSKSNYEQPVRRTYVGPTVAVRASYRIQNDLLLFVEPRFTLADYSIPYRKVNASAKFSDKLAGISVGLEFDNPVLKRHEFNESFSRFFQREWLLQADAGLNQPIQGIRYQSHSYMDILTGVTLGYMVNPVTTPSLRMDMARINVDEEAGYRQYHLFSVTPQYRVNLMNALQGYEPKRRFEVQAFAGPVVSYRAKATRNRQQAEETRATDEAAIAEPSEERANGVFVGGEVGFNVRYRLQRHWGVYIEPQLRVYGTDVMPSVVNAGLKKMFSVQAGISYQFVHHKKAKYEAR